MPSTAVLDDLRAACDDQARPAEKVDAVAGVPARYVAAPASTAQTAQVLRAAAAHGLRIVARGAGTKLGWGSPPAAVDLLLDTSRLDGVVEHAAGDLVVVVRAGTTLDQLQSALAEAGQQLALDHPHPGATIGGTVATNTSGPRRLLYGTLRDLMIGATFVRADGVVAKSGGKVVKNVAGYDFGKLLIGSYGTLGVLTEAAFRLHPLPRAARFLSVEVPGGDEAGSVVAALLGSQVVPAAVEVDRPAGGGVTVGVLVEGTEQGVAARGRTTAQVLGDATETDDPPAWFGAYPFDSAQVGLKLTTEIAGLPALLAAVAATAERRAVPIAVRGSAAGVVYAGLAREVEPEAAAAVVTDLRGSAPRYGGSVVVLTAPAPVRDALDMWGPVPALDLMRRVKHELDPDRRLAPGRFVGGI
jgi:glycolate oxidase FAD binding subunit